MDLGRARRRGAHGGADGVDDVGLSHGGVLLDSGRSARPNLSARGGDGSCESGRSQQRDDARAALDERGGALRDAPHHGADHGDSRIRCVQRRLCRQRRARPDRPGRRPHPHPPAPGGPAGTGVPAPAPGTAAPLLVAGSGSRPPGSGPPAGAVRSARDGPAARPPSARPSGSGSTERGSPPSPSCALGPACGRAAGASLPRASAGPGRKRCTRYTKVGAFNRTSTAGANRFRFTGRLRSRALRRGTYRLSATAKVRGGKAGKPAAKRFTIDR